MNKLLLVLLLVSTQCYANELPLEEYIEVGSLVRKPQSQVGKTVNIIDSTILDEYKFANLSDSFHNVPGIYVKRVNGQSGLTNIRIRGARSIDTKLLFNGIPLQDPSDPQGSANPFIGDLLAQGVSKVEVLSGASSSTWGSEAIGGVVNIVPKKGELNGLRAFVEGGTYRTFREGAEVTAPGIFLEATRLDSEGFDHHDDYSQTHFSGNINRDFDRFNVEGTWLYQRTSAMLNDGPVITGGVLQEDVDDPNDKREYEVVHSSLKTTVDIRDNIVFKNTIGVTESDRRFTFLPDSEFDWYSDGIFRGNDFILQDQVTFTHNDYLATTVGHQYERQWYELDQKDVKESDQADYYSNDYYLEENVDYKNLHLILAIRENTHEYAKSRATFDISGVVDLPKFNTRLHSHLGTSYRYPSLYEQYGAFLTSFGRFEIGNAGLSPERAKSFDIGADWRITPNTDVGGTFFWNDIRNKISFRGLSYANQDGVDSNRGIEVYLERYLLDGLSIRTSYTYTEGDNLVDVPESLWDVSLRYAKDKWIANVRTRYVSDHKIMAFNMDDFTVDTLTEKGRFTLDSTISYKIKPDVEVFVRVENLLGEDYNEGGYRTPGARVYGGITWTI